MNKGDVVDIYNELLLNHQKGMKSISSNMDRTWSLFYLVKEVRQRKTNDFTYVWNVKHKTSEQTKQNRNGLRDTEQTGGCQKG